MILNTGGEIPDCITENKKHTWIVVKKPEGNRGGWHIEKCIACGQIKEWDDSD